MILDSFFQDVRVGLRVLFKDKTFCFLAVLVLALAYFGFFLNLFNLIPVGIFDGGAVWRSARWLRLGGGRDKATIAYVQFNQIAIAHQGQWTTNKRLGRDM